MKMKNISYQPHSKKPIGKAILLFTIVIITTSCVLAMGLDISTLNNRNNKNTENEDSLNQEGNFILHDRNFYISLGITNCEFPEESTLLYGALSIGIFLITDVAMVVKRQNKIAKTESNKKNNGISNHECLILELVQEYLSKNRYLEIDKVIPFIIARLSKTDSLNKGVFILEEILIS